MSANKTIKALREEREGLYSEIRRLQLAAGETRTFGQILRDAKALQAEKRLGIKREPLAFRDMELIAQQMTGFQVPTHWLFGHESDESMRAHLVELGVDVEHPSVAAALSGSTTEFVKSLSVLEHREQSMLDTFKRQYLGEFKPLGPNWAEAPKDATHALVKALELYGGNVIWLKLSEHPAGPAFRWSREAGWLKAYNSTADALASEYVKARPEAQDGPQSFIEMHLHRGAESLVSRIDIRGDVTLTQVYNTAHNALGGYSNRVPAPPEPQPVNGGNNGKVLPWYEWEEAPEGATHAITGTPALWMKLQDGETAYFWRESFGQKDGHWKDSGHPASLYQGSAHVVARPVPEEVWSLDGKNGSWDYPSLAELLKEHYGHVSDDNGSGLFVGSTLYRAIVCKDDPAQFLPDADKITEHMWDMACMSDAGEWVDGYPELKTEGAQALDKALAPLKKWARQYCQPDFFTVKDVTPHELTEEDVRAAGLHPNLFTG